MDYLNLIVLTRHTTVWDDRCGEDKEISNNSFPLEWKLKCSKHYEHDELMVIAANMDQLYFILAPKVIATIRQLWLNKKRHGKRGVRLTRPQGDNHTTHQIGINFHNIAAVRRSSMITRKQFHLSGLMANCQSIKSKDLIAHEHLVSNNMDFGIFTETWLLENLDDIIWCVTSPLQNCGFKIFTSNWKSRRGGSLAIVYREGLEVDLVQEGKLPSFQFAIWRIESGNQCVFAVSIYRPPYTTTNQITDAQFTTDFAEWIPYITIQYKNTIILGDFNIHINDSMGTNASIYQDVMAASGLSQWVDFPTHRLGNTLGLFFTKCSSNIAVTSCTQGPLWSDHFAVKMSFSMPKVSLKHQELHYWKIRSIDTKLFGKAIDIHSLLNIDDIEELVSKFSGNLKSTLDATAPFKTKVVTQHPPKVWFSDSITQQKQVVRNREHVFKKYKSESTWLALKAERHKLHNAIYLAKKDHISDLVASCGNDSGKVYKLVNHLTGCKSECPLPDKDPESLAKEFADFFLDKITTIHHDLAKFTPYPCEVRNQSGFQQFWSMT